MSDQRDEGNLQLNTIPLIWLLLRQYNCMAGILFLRNFQEATQASVNESRRNTNTTLDTIFVYLKLFICWLVEKDNGQEQTFLVKAISSGNNLARALIILVFIFSFLYLVTQEILERIGDQVDEITFSDEGNPIIKIKGKQQLQVISVPAYQKWISSGVTLNKNTKIEIRATGSIATGLTIPRYLEDLLYKQFNNELGWRLSRLEFNENVYLGWREADGQLIQEYGSSDDPKDKIYRSECIHNKSKEKKILQEVPYGALLGFFAENKTPLENHNQPHLEDNFFQNINKSNFFKIGKEAEIEFITRNNLYRVTYLDEEKNYRIKDFPARQWGGKILYFTINETIVKNKKELSMFTECLKTEPTRPEHKHIRKYIIHLEQRYQEIYDKLDNSESIWFMDNKGDFTVTIIINE